MHGSKGVIKRVGGNSIRNRVGMFGRSEELLKKFKKLLVRVREMRRKVCMGGISTRLDENEEWWSRALDVNERVQVIYQYMDHQINLMNIFS